MQTTLFKGHFLCGRFAITITFWKEDKFLPCGETIFVLRSLLFDGRSIFILSGKANIVFELTPFIETHSL